MGTKRKMMLASVLIMLLAIVACTPGNIPNAAPASVAQAPAAAAPAPAAAVGPKTPAKEAWQGKWDSLVQGATKEGKVVIYTTSNAETRIAYQRAFKDRFNVNTELVGGSASAVGAKVMAERRAGLRLGDLLMGSGTQAVSFLKPAGFVEPIDVGGVLILPEFSDPKLWLGGGFFWQDAEHTSLTYCRYEQQVAARNTELVKEGEIQSYNDLLNAKWKGKIVIADPSLGGIALKCLAMAGRYTMGWDWLRALVKQEPLIIADFRLQAEWLARGKYAIGYGVKLDELYAFKKMGLPVDTIFMREGGYLASGSGMISLLKDAPHASSARLFINWLLTKEGQTVFTSTGGYPSARLDVSDQGMLYPRAAQDTKAPAGDIEEAILKQNDDLKIVKEILLPLLLR